MRATTTMQLDPRADVATAMVFEAFYAALYPFVRKWEARSGRPATRDDMVSLFASEAERCWRWGGAPSEELSMFGPGGRPRS